VLLLVGELVLDDVPCDKLVRLEERVDPRGVVAARVESGLGAVVAMVREAIAADDAEPHDHAVDHLLVPHTPRLGVVLRASGGLAAVESSAVGADGVAGLDDAVEANVLGVLDGGAVEHDPFDGLGVAGVELVLGDVLVLELPGQNLVVGLDNVHRGGVAGLGLPVLDAADAGDDLELGFLGLRKGNRSGSGGLAAPLSGVEEFAHLPHLLRADGVVVQLEDGNELRRRHEIDGEVPVRGEVLARLRRHQAPLGGARRIRGRRSDGVVVVDNDNVGGGSALGNGILRRLRLGEHELPIGGDIVGEGDARPVAVDADGAPSVEANLGEEDTRGDADVVL